MDSGKLSVERSPDRLCFLVAIVAEAVEGLVSVLPWLQILAVVVSVVNLQAWASDGIYLSV